MAGSGEAEAWTGWAVGARSGKAAWGLVGQGSHVTDGRGKSGAGKAWQSSQGLVWNG